MEATYAPARASLLDPMRAWRGEIRERLPESALRQVSRAVTRHPLYECKAAGIEVWFSQTPMRLINWELPLILRFRWGPVLRAVIAFAMASFRSRAALQFEILALRHQIGVLQRSVKRPKLTPADRVLWAWLCCIWKGWQSGAFIMKAATVVGWYRKGFGLFWSWKIRRGKLGRPAVPTEVRELIGMLSRENRLWGAPHIHGELLKAWHPCR